MEANFTIRLPGNFRNYDTSIYRVSYESFNNLQNGAGVEIPGWLTHPFPAILRVRE
jgi:hypothetical protein